MPIGIEPDEPKYVIDRKIMLDQEGIDIDAENPYIKCKIGDKIKIIGLDNNKKNRYKIGSVGTILVKHEHIDNGRRKFFLTVKFESGYQTHIEEGKDIIEIL